MEYENTVLIVDDTKENIDVLGNLLKDTYNVKFALSGKMALKIAEKFRPDLILLDIMMPDMDGYETCRRLKDNILTSEIPVIFVTAKVGVIDEKKGFDVGAVDYITKPITPLLVKTRVKNHLDLSSKKKALSSLVKEKTKKLKKLNHEIIKILGRASEYNDDNTGEHIKRIGSFVEIIAKNMNLEMSQIELLKEASSMHDVGKIGVPDKILNKPGKLNDKEWQQILKHPDFGKEILGKHESELLKMASKIAYEHHEKWDGTGYPLGKKGIEISLEARIVSVADVFDALTSKRPYKEVWSEKKAFELIKKEAGKHFDPKVVKAFLKDKNKIIQIKNIINSGDLHEY